MLNPKQGKLYEFQLVDGNTLILRFDGLGQWMQPIWFDTATGTIRNSLPPYVSFKQID
jgi:hypothetical protein